MTQASAIVAELDRLFTPRFELEREWLPSRAYPGRELHLVMDNYATHVCPESEVREM